MNLIGCIFGVHLTELTNRPSLKPFLPDIVVKLTEFIRNKGKDQNYRNWKIIIAIGVDDEGILRISGSNIMVQKFRDSFDSGMLVEK